MVPGLNRSRSCITGDEWARIPEDGRRAIAAAVGANQPETPTPRLLTVNSLYASYGKRVLDLAIGLPAFLVCLPVNGVLAIVTYLDVGRPIFFKQERVGRDERPFTLVKFRSMTNEVNEEGVLLQPEDRVTRWGRFVRKTSLDELMNLWSVIKGDMSIIGPRPLPKKYLGRYSAYHRQRHLVKPGLECPFHDKALANKGWQGRLDNDVWYVEHMSLATDIQMFILLVKKVFSKKERSKSASGKTGEFIGYRPDGTVMDEWGIPCGYLAVLQYDRKKRG